MNASLFRTALLVTLVSISVAGKSNAQSPSGSTAPTAPPGYKLVWSDEFSQEPDGLPDPKKWSYEEGFIRNNESQYYTKARKENARIENGRLIIEGRKEEYTPPGAAAPVAHYTSAALETSGKADWQYGRIEVRAKLPAGKGVWPAIWTLGSNIHEVGWPRCGEIDIMELVGKEPGIIHGTLHYFVDGKHGSSGGSLPVDHPEAGFHIYAAEWNPARIDIFVDDKKYFSLDVGKAADKGENPFHKPHFLILNLALGGDWGGPIDDSIFPQRMTVDYVRIYQRPPPSP
ncbi:MAG TPA: glycoside hydrolase family 16 protein [Candidatus Methylacidiphilales bacterium]|jgi:beta-glucanase (GH16 family)|nr:glycoside hydrolase family 16 protein [Candidatus Methylacidiphilales bacterium]